MFKWSIWHLLLGLSIISLYLWWYASCLYFGVHIVLTLYTYSVSSFKRQYWKLGHAPLCACSHNLEWRFELVFTAEQTKTLQSLVLAMWALAWYLVLLRCLCQTHTKLAPSFCLETPKQIQDTIWYVCYAYVSPLLCSRSEKLSFYTNTCQA